MAADPTWESFVAGLVDHYAPRRDGDCTLWRVSKPNRKIVCRVRELRPAEYVGLELRVEHNGQVDRTEVHKDASPSVNASRSCGHSWKRKAGRAP